MRLMILFLLTSCVASSQATECETQPACEEAIRKHPKDSLAHYRLAEIYLQNEDWQSAANQYRDAIAGDQKPKWVVAWSHVNPGKIFDTQDQRARAVNEYRKAQQTGDNTHGALDEAARYVAAPFRR